MYGVIPDATFALRYAHRPAGRQTAYFFLEIYRGTMPIARGNLARTSLAREFLAYHGAWKQKIHTRLFGFPNFRVLTVTTTAEGARNIAEALPQIIGRRSGLFLLATTMHIPHSAADKSKFEGPALWHWLTRKVERQAGPKPRQNAEMFLNDLVPDGRLYLGASPTTHSASPGSSRSAPQVRLPR